MLTPASSTATSYYRRSGEAGRPTRVPPTHLSENETPGSHVVGILGTDGTTRGRGL